jgi:hypothetical protein
MYCTCLPLSQLVYVHDLCADELTATLYRLCFVALGRSKALAPYRSGWVMVHRLHRRVNWLVGSRRDSCARVLRPASNCPAIRSEKLACGSNGTWTCCIAGQTRLSMSSVGLSSAWRSFEGMSAWKTCACVVSEALVTSNRTWGMNCQWDEEQGNKVWHTKKVSGVVWPFCRCSWARDSRTQTKYGSSNHSAGVKSRNRRW